MPPCLATSAHRAFYSKIDYSYELSFLFALPSRAETSPEDLAMVDCNMLSIKFCLSDSYTDYVLIDAAGDKIVYVVSIVYCDKAPGCSATNDEVDYFSSDYAVLEPKISD